MKIAAANLTARRSPTASSTTQWSPAAPSSSRFPLRNTQFVFTKVFDSVADITLVYKKVVAIIVPPPRGKHHVRLRDGGRYHVRWHEGCGHHIRPHESCRHHVRVQKVVAIIVPHGDAARFDGIKVAGIKLDYIKVSGSTFIRIKMANSAFDCTKVAGSASVLSTVSLGMGATVFTDKVAGSASVLSTVSLGSFGPFTYDKVAGSASVLSTVSLSDSQGNFGLRPFTCDRVAGSASVLSTVSLRALHLRQGRRQRFRPIDGQPR